MTTRIAILIPCYNESATIVQVIQDFKQHLPEALIYVYDNLSSDNSIQLAKQQDVIIKSVPKRGKGHVVRRMFTEVDADIYVMVDGDATYDASAALNAIRSLEEHSLDMVICTRRPTTTDSFRLGHHIGNKWFTHSINFLFKQKLKDVFSGYRVFSRRFVKSFPVITNGFEIETEMTIHALQLDVPTLEMETLYKERPSGSLSKLKTVKDGLKILRALLSLYMYVRPLIIFGGLFVVFSLISLLLGIPIIIDFLKTGLVPRIPTATLAVSLGILAWICLACGIILDSISRSRLETKKLYYLLNASK